MRLAILAAAVLLAGCSAPPSATTTQTSDVPTPTVDPVPWFLHVERTCDEEFGCNCGAFQKSMDAERRDSPCDVHGRTTPMDQQGQPCDHTGSFLPPGTTAGHAQECYPAATPFPAMAPGSRVNGTLFLTASGDESLVIHVELAANGTTVGSDERTAHVVGAPTTRLEGCPCAWTPVHFDLNTTAPIGGNATVVLNVGIEYHDSYYIGYSADHASYLILAPASA